MIFLHAFDNVMEKEPSAKFYGVFDYFSRTYEVRKFEKIKLCLRVIHESILIH